MPKDPETLCPKHFSLTSFIYWGVGRRRGEGVLGVLYPVSPLENYRCGGLWKKTTRLSPDFTDEVAEGHQGEGAFKELGS